jgi:hypothetical protein
MSHRDPYNRQSLIVLLNRRRLLQGSPQQKTHQYLFNKFNVENPAEMKAATIILADALTEPIKDFERYVTNVAIVYYRKYKKRVREITKAI